MITEDYVSSETAKLLKEKGFDETVRCFYDIRTEILCDDCVKTKNSYTRSIAAPTLQMAMKWLREVHNITIGITFSFDIVSYEIQKNGEFITSIGSSRTYEQMVEEAIQLCIKTLI